MQPVHAQAQVEQASEGRSSPPGSPARKGTQTSMTKSSVSAQEAPLQAARPGPWRRSAANRCDQCLTTRARQEAAPEHEVPPGLCHVRRGEHGRYRG